MRTVLAAVTTSLVLAVALFEATAHAAVTGRDAGSVAAVSGAGVDATPRGLTGRTLTLTIRRGRPSRALTA